MVESPSRPNLAFCRPCGVGAWWCYLIASMGLQALWILGLACLDGYVLKVKRDLNNAILVSLFVVGDW
ncbi:hypothetical protein CFC21_053881, partial [Triticum aestivum]